MPPEVDRSGTLPKTPEGWVRQRAERIDVGMTRRAIAAVGPVLTKVNQWQTRAAHLKALAQHRKKTGEPVEEIVDAANVLLAEIEANRVFLDRCRETLPPEVIGHSRFQDVVRAVSTASVAVNQVLSSAGRR